MAVNTRDFDCKNIGPNNVILTVTDNSGNTGTCTAVVTVNYSANPLLTPATDVICDKETTNIRLTCDIPGTTWTWTVNSSPEISGATDDNSGLNSSIIQHLNNMDLIVHNVIYNIIPGVYGKCNLAPITAEVRVNPAPEIEVDMRDTVICDGESTIISVLNPNTSVSGQWMYDLTVESDAGITGNSINGSYTAATDLTETLFNNDTIRHKVIYRFTPFIVPDDGGMVCGGKEKKFTIWVHPGLRYTAESSDFNGFNISCFGKSDGFINIEPSIELSPFTFRWTGPGTFTASTRDIKGLIAGLYTMSITDRNGCTTNEIFELTEPDKLGMTIISSISSDGAYNINCAGGKTGSINVTAFNNAGLVDYLWADGFIGKTRTDLGAAAYKVIISDSNGCHAESVVALTEPEPVKLAFDKTDPLCPEKPDGQIKLTVTGGISGNAYSYLWSDNSTLPAISNIPAGYYSVTVTDMNGCSVKDSVRLLGMNKICLTIPEAFSPNKDLINDIWNIENTDLYPQIEITIYNRWGQALWKSKRGYPVPWNGRTNGEDLPVDSYHYIIDLNNGSKPIIGSITIIR
jgi:gliding motility-associated-like protein